jgi:predicted O-methyltransferase YrrM
VAWVKPPAGQDLDDDRFKTIVSLLGRGLSSLSLPDACRIGLVADQLGALTGPYAAWGWAADIGYHFAVSSSPPWKGRLLATLVRYAQADICLELGTGYGLSALFLSTALRARRGGRLTTVENFEPQFSIARDLLGAHEAERVCCRQGPTTEVIPTLDLASEVGFVFHDANHTAEAYVEDFTALEPLLKPGAIVLFDDVRWENPLPEAPSAGTYDGWSEVVKHPRVTHAVEINEQLGLLRVR